MKKPVLKIKPYRGSDNKYKFYLNLRGFGGGRMFFKTRAEAEAECLRQKTLLERHSREAVGLQQRDMSDFISARKRLAEYGHTINDAVKFFVNHLESVRRCKTTVNELAAEVIEAKRRDGRSDAYLSDLRKRLSRFCRHFGDRPITSVTIEEADNWLRDLPLSPKSRANYRANVGVVFSYAKQRRMVELNPIEFTAKPKLPDNPPEIFTVDELRALLEAAQRQAPDVLPMLAIGATGKVERVRKETLASKWPNNGLRHSFASYRLAAIHDAPRTSSELGHTSPQMLYNTYRELVLPEEAERYWKIEPTPESGKLVAFKSRA